MNTRHESKWIMVFKKLLLLKGCIDAAASILENMDANVSPCEDFYRFACGGFIRRTMIPDDKTRVTMFSVVEDKLHEQV